jgi:hypothetical protein
LLDEHDTADRCPLGSAGAGTDPIVQPDAKAPAALTKHTPITNRTTTTARNPRATPGPLDNDGPDVRQAPNGRSAMHSSLVRPARGKCGRSRWLEARGTLAAGVDHALTRDSSLKPPPSNALHQQVTRSMNDSLRHVPCSAYWILCVTTNTAQKSSARETRSTSTAMIKTQRRRAVLPAPSSAHARTHAPGETREAHVPAGATRETEHGQMPAGGSTHFSYVAAAATS